MNMNMNNNMNNNAPQIEDKNLSVIKDQLSHECLLNKKYSLYSEYCTDQNLKNLCNEAATVHKQNFTELKNYLDSHQ
ncbi:hypothetical protein HAHI6034_12480 [Hathewaya histolytica]|uniref:Spore coat protein n=1 Tax=Hathewaya histolytica TaxID=1498 RepID=A0A4U9R512_HATHI|nr:hypothetical protein [Hathewaya histolytica]VTQ86156.1 Uncharacterised protein [Hathewaya histolytica]